LQHYISFPGAAIKQMTTLAYSILPGVLASDINAQSYILSEATRSFRLRATQAGQLKACQRTASRVKAKLHCHYIRTKNKLFQPERKADLNKGDRLFLLEALKNLNRIIPDCQYSVNEK
jgi:hypothetical protein